MRCRTIATERAVRRRNWLGAGLLAVIGAISSVNAASAADAPAESPARDKRALSSYLHDLSTKKSGVSRATATLEYYRIPTSSGAVLDSWLWRPPGSAGQPLVLVPTPYYGGGSPAWDQVQHAAHMLADKLLPYGYAVGLLSVGGTGNSGGCFRNGGAIERKQLSDAIEYLSKRSWSNGAVGTIGVSYDGTTSTELFIDPPAALKTIVPIAAITDYYRYSFHPGGIISNAYIFTTYYYPMVGLSPAGLSGGVGLTDPTGFVYQVSGEPCADQLYIQRDAITTHPTADKNAHWQARDAIALVEANPDIPRPSVFYVQGYQDGNTRPDLADGWLEAVSKTGVPLHVWFGQWMHAWPEASGCKAKDPCRNDFFEKFLLAWFDQFLKGKDTGVLDAPQVQSQADDGVWRHEDSWPPQTSELLYYPGAAGQLGTAPGKGSVTFTDSTMAISGTGTRVEFVSAPLSERLRLTGIPRLVSRLRADNTKGHAIVTLLERKADGKQRYLNFAAINLNHAESIETSDPDVTGKWLDVAMNFYPQDNIVAAGSKLVLTIGSSLETTHTSTGRGDLVNGYPFLDTGVELYPLGVGAQVEVDLTQTLLLLPKSPTNYVEPR